MTTTPCSLLVLQQTINNAWTLQRQITYFLFQKKNMPQGGFEPPSKDPKRNKRGVSLILAYMGPGKSSKLERCTPSTLNMFLKVPYNNSHNDLQFMDLVSNKGSR